MSDDQRTPAEQVKPPFPTRAQPHADSRAQEELLALQAMRAALESLRTTTGTLADDLDKAKGSYGKFTSEPTRRGVRGEELMRLLGRGRGGLEGGVGGDGGGWEGEWEHGEGEWSGGEESSRVKGLLR